MYRPGSPGRKRSGGEDGCLQNVFSHILSLSSSLFSPIILPQCTSSFIMTVQVASLMGIGEHLGYHYRLIYSNALASSPAMSSCPLRASGQCGGGELLCKLCECIEQGSQNLAPTPLPCTHPSCFPRLVSTVCRCCVGKSISGH